MHIRDVVHNAHKLARKTLGKNSNPWFNFGDAFHAPDDRRDLKQHAKGDLAGIFYDHDGRVIHKWTHYLEIYDRHFASYRVEGVKFLEIGISFGGSLEMWRKYFGSSATIYGIDVDPNCADRVSAPNVARIGSQDDANFLKSVVEEMGAPDIILDDGSHIGRHQLESFRVLFPLLKEGGLYAIEDLHTAYWPGTHEGGYRRKTSAIELVKDMIDDMHAWYHGKIPTTPAKTEIGAIHIYDSIVIIEKAKRQPPRHIQVGKL